jgi:hypothetical protein
MLGVGTGICRNFLRKDGISRIVTSQTTVSKETMAASAIIANKFGPERAPQTAPGRGQPKKNY